MRALSLLVLGIAFTWALAVQEALCADVAGLVADGQGRPVAGVRIVVKNVQNKVSKEAPSNSDGRYQVTGLKPGVYTYILDPAGSGFKGGDAVSYLGSKGLTIDWHLSTSSSAIALASDATGSLAAGDPYGFTDQEYTGVVLGSAGLVAGGVAGGLAASGAFSGSSSSPPASPAL
jgi:hypothetical protein